MKLYIDPTGGIAGDMFSAALISAGASEKKVIKAMKLAAEKIGTASIKALKATDESTQLQIDLSSNYKHLKGSKAKEIVSKIFNELNIQTYYKEFGLTILEILIQAERKAHSENLFESDHFHISPVGKFHTPYQSHAPFQPDKNEKGDFYIELFPKYAEGLKKLTSFTHAFIIAYLNKVHGFSLTAVPPVKDKNIEVGVFASRSPHRPNPIGLNIVEIIKAENNRLYTSPVDFLNNTPVVDIKPVIKSLDGHATANEGWIENTGGLLPHTHEHEHGHSHSHDSKDAYLHEAQDIIIDITGAVMGMQDLDIETKASIIAPVSAGGGIVNFSHGKLPVPAPATKIIFDKHAIEWSKGPVETELCTPTGSAILAALNVDKIIQLPKSIKSGISRGTKKLNIPPLKIYLAD